MQHFSDGKLYDLSKNRPEVTKKSALTSAKTWTLKLASTLLLLFGSFFEDMNAGGTDGKLYEIIT